MQGARSLIKKLSMEPELHSLIRSMQKVAEAVIEMAYYEVKRERTVVEYTIPTNLKIRKLGNVEHVSVPTYNLPIKINKDYSNIIGKLTLRIISNLLYGTNI